MREIIKHKLKKYHFDFSDRGNTINVKLGYGLISTITFYSDSSIAINNKLTGWNHLTGLIDMSLKSSLIYQSVGLFIATILLSRVNDADLPINIFLLFIGAGIYTLIWTIYYFVKAESFKKQIIDWCDNTDTKGNIKISD